MFFKEYPISFLTVCSLTDFALVVLKLLMFKVCGIIGISKIELFNYSSNERVNGTSLLLSSMCIIILSDKDLIKLALFFTKKKLANK